jgi:glycosyltransferase involved in cell wall biosynthesis
MPAELADHASFEKDDHAGAPKILFVGFAESSHTHSWIDLLEHQYFNRRLFALPSAVPPPDWRVRTYVTIDAPKLDPAIRKSVLTPAPAPKRRSTMQRLLLGKTNVSLASTSLERALADVILSWRPHIVHTLGLESASYFFNYTRRVHPEVVGIGRWVVQVRGGPDLALHQHEKEYRTKIVDVLAQCDHLIADNPINYRDAVALGLSPEKVDSPGLGVVSGPGGLDIESLRSTWTKLPSQRQRTILWPKTYETISSKALPVFEAIKLAWDRIAPVSFEMLWLVQSDVQIWFEKSMPDHIKAACRLYGRLPRQDVLKMLSSARIMLAPSLTDGIPNSMMEAMALGAFPIVSPLDTIMPVVENEKNVLFARNLYPHEIADALIRAMSDDRLVDAAAEKNAIRVIELADRKRIVRDVVNYYLEIVSLSTNKTGHAA